MSKGQMETGGIRLLSPLYASAKALWSFLQQLRRRPLSLIGFFIVLFYLLLALLGPSLAPYAYDAIQRGEDRRALRNLPPSPQYPLGTDKNGFDVLSRVLWGARDTIGLPVIATSLAVLVGAFTGLLAGYRGGWLDEIISRILDALLAIPALILALVLLTTLVPLLNQLENEIIRRIGSVNISLVMVILLLYAPIVARVARSATLGVRERGFVEAARLRGEPLLYILFREILPSILPALIVEASLRLSYSIFLIASLGFLGLGVQPPSPEWGRMVLDARSEISAAPWSLYAPVFTIVTLIIGVNLFSDGLRYLFRSEDSLG